jgi:hypothetical protein
MKSKEPICIYLDDVRTPIQPPSNWVIVRDYQELVDKVMEVGLNNIQMISLDHDLGDSAMSEYFNNVSPNYALDYSNITERTGMDCAKWLVNHFYEIQESNAEVSFPLVYTHSANPIGSANIMGYINNFLMNENKPQTCVRVMIPHTV